MQKQKEDYKKIAERLDEQVKQIIATEKRLYDVQHRLDREVAGLKKMQKLVGEMLTAGFSTKKICEAVMNFVVIEMEMEKAALFLKNSEGYNLHCHSGYKSEEAENFSCLKESSILFSQIEKNQEAKVFDYRQTKDVEGADEAYELNLIYFVGVPLKGKKGRPIGVLLAGYSERSIEAFMPEIFEEDIILLGGLGDQAALFIENSQINEALDRTLKDLEMEKDKVSSIINNLSEGLVATDYEGKVILVNPKAEELLDAKDKDLLDKILTEDFADKNGIRDFYDVVYSEMKNEEKRELEINNPIKRILQITSVDVINSAKKFLGNMRVVSDITREKEIDTMKSQFISVAAHQLRTPLSAIKWVMKMVIDGDAGKLNKEQHELLMKGYKSNERIIKLVNDLLNVSRLEEGRFGYSFASYNFQEVLDAVCEDTESIAAREHINFELKKPEVLPELTLDKERISMVISNVLDNSFKYTPENGRVELIIEADNRILKIKIKDNGVGIPAKDQEKLFTKFFRANNVVRMQTEGTGLGLYIVRNIVEKHGGKIGIESEEGKGTEVEISLPIK